MSGTARASCMYMLCQLLLCQAEAALHQVMHACKRERLHGTAARSMHACMWRPSERSGAALRSRCMLNDVPEAVVVD